MANWAARGRSRWAKPPRAAARISDVSFKEANVAKVDPVSVVQSYLAALAIMVGQTADLLAKIHKVRQVVVKSERLVSPTWFKQIQVRSSGMNLKVITFG